MGAMCLKFRLVDTHGLWDIPHLKAGHRGGHLAQSVGSSGSENALLGSLGLRDGRRAGG